MNWGPGEVVVQVGAAGACHSDLHLMHDFEAGTLPWDPPFTLGHENAGWVHALGAGVEAWTWSNRSRSWERGAAAPAGHCPDGLETYCDRPDLAPVPGGGGGLGLDGGIGRIPAGARSPPPGPDPGRARPDPGRSVDRRGPHSYHAVDGLSTSWADRDCRRHRRRRARAPGGADPSGHHRCSRGRDRSPGLRARPRGPVRCRPGAAAGDLVAEIRDFTHGLGADVVIDCVGSDETLAAAAASARQLADITIVGIAGGTLPLSFFGVPYEASVQTTYWGNRRELVEVLDLASRGLLNAATTIYTLDDAAQAYRDLAHGTVNGRAVIVPTDSYRP